MGPFKRYILVKGLKFAPHFGLNENLTFYPEPTVVDIVIKFVIVLFNLAAINQCHIMINNQELLRIVGLILFVCAAGKKIRNANQLYQHDNLLCQN